MHELNCMVWLVKLIIELDCTGVEIHDFTTWLKKYFWCFNKRQGSIIYRNLPSIQVHGLMVINFQVWILHLYLKNIQSECHIQKYCILIGRFWRTCIKLVLKTYSPMRFLLNSEQSLVNMYLWQFTHWYSITPSIL